MPAIWTSRQPWVRRPSGLVTLNRGSGQARGLLGWWAAARPGRFADLAAGNDGTMGATEAVISDIGAVVELGASGYVDVQNVARYQRTSGVTWTAWVRPDVAGADHDVQTVVSTGTGTLAYDLYCSVGGGHANIYSVGAGNWFDGTDPIVVGAWNLAAWRVSSVTRGVSANGRPWQSSGYISNYTGYDLKLGRRVDGLGAAPTFDGKIAEVRCYGRLLTDAEIRALYDPRTRWELYQPIVRRVYFDLAGGGGGSPQTLSGSAASAMWTVPAGTLAPGAKELNIGLKVSSTWMIQDGVLTPGPRALAGTAASGAWTLPAGALTAGSVALSGTAASVAWSVPSGALTVGAVALSGTSASGAWTLPAGSLTTGASLQTLAGSAASAAWACAGLLSSTVALPGASASSAWTVPSGAITVTTALVGNPASAIWALPTGALTAGAAALSGTAAIATWVVLGGTFTRAVDREAWVALFGEPGSSGPVTGRLGPDSGFVRPVSSRLS